VVVVAHAAFAQIGYLDAAPAVPEELRLWAELSDVKKQRATKK